MVYNFGHAGGNDNLGEIIAILKGGGGNLHHRIGHIVAARLVLVAEDYLRLILIVGDAVLGDVQNVVRREHHVQPPIDVHIQCVYVHNRLVHRQRTAESGRICHKGVQRLIVQRMVNHAVGIAFLRYGNLQQVIAILEHIGAQILDAAAEVNALQTVGQALNEIVADGGNRIGDNQMLHPVQVTQIGDTRYRLIVDVRGNLQRLPCLEAVGDNNAVGALAILINAVVAQINDFHLIGELVTGDGAGGLIDETHRPGILRTLVIRPGQVVPATVPVETAVSIHRTVLHRNRVAVGGSIIAEVLYLIVAVLLRIVDVVPIPVTVLVLNQLQRLYLHRGNGGIDNFRRVGKGIAGNRTLSLIGVAHRPLILIVLVSGTLYTVPTIVPFEAFVLIHRTIFHGNRVSIGRIIIAEITHFLAITEIFVIDIIPIPIAVGAFNKLYRLYRYRSNRGFHNLHLVGQAIPHKGAFHRIGVSYRPLVFAVLRIVVVDRVIGAVPNQTILVNRTVLHRDGVAAGRAVIPIILDTLFGVGGFVIIIFRVPITVGVFDEHQRLHHHGGDGRFGNFHLESEFITHNGAFHLIGVAFRPLILIALRVVIIDAIPVAVPFRVLVFVHRTVFHRDGVVANRHLIAEILHFLKGVGFLIIDTVPTPVAVRARCNLQRFHHHRNDRRCLHLYGEAELVAGDFALYRIGVARLPSTIPRLPVVQRNVIVIPLVVEIIILDCGAIDEGDGILRLIFIAIVILFLTIYVIVVSVAVNAFGYPNRLHLHRFNQTADNLHIIDEFVAQNRALYLIGVAGQPRIFGALVSLIFRRVPLAVPFDAFIHVHRTVLHGDGVLHRVAIIAEILHFLVTTQLFVINVVPGPIAVLLSQQATRLNLHRSHGGFDNLHLIGELVAQNRARSGIGVSNRPLVFGVLRVGISHAVPFTIPQNRLVFVHGTVPHSNGILSGLAIVMEEL